MKLPAVIWWPERPVKTAAFTGLTVYLMADARQDVLHEEENGAASARTMIADWIMRNQA